MRTVFEVIFFTITATCCTGIFVIMGLDAIHRYNPPAALIPLCDVVGGPQRMDHKAFWWGSTPTGEECYIVIREK